MPECTCFEVPHQYWTTHYGAVEPGSTLEPNPECLEHFPETAPRHRLVLSVAAAEHELETVATLMESIGTVAAHTEVWRVLTGQLDRQANLRTTDVRDIVRGDIFGELS
jgi:hypothetical protein